jgi:hypothetical protein
MRKYVIFGPADTLKRIGTGLVEELKPKNSYEFQHENNETLIIVAVFEEYQRHINSSTSLTCIYEFSNRSVKYELMPTGGRMGFRGSSMDVERTIVASVIDYITDFSKRFGLTLQEVEIPDDDDEE